MHFDDNENEYLRKTYQCGQGLAKGASIVIIRRAQINNNSNNSKFYYFRLVKSKMFIDN